MVKKVLETSVTVDVAMSHQPESDPVELEHARAKTERALFGQAEPARVGRYEIRDPIARGGMGKVFAAYDPELDRPVALKVLHPSRADESRLVVEARALARLDHPNVVKVHDVPKVDGRLVIVMELVEGVTLADWSAERRAWQDVLEVYIQAGDGLAAAHALDVIHRDFKPSNAVVGTDGRVRVLDFGLARLAEDDTGAVLGTLAFAAPEQLRGDTATPASDQFSFCVSLYRALAGTPPFAGTTVDEIVENIGANNVVPSPELRQVPEWLRGAVRRGLSADPAQRHPSMGTLLAELRRPRGFRRWRLPLAAIGLVAIAGVGTRALLHTNGADACDGGDDELADVWSPSIRADLAQRLSTSADPYTIEVRERALATIDGWTARWSTAHRNACNRRAEMSDQLLDRSMSCLHHRLSDLSSAMSVLRSDRSSPSGAIDVAARLPSPEPCSDLDLLKSDVDPPATSAISLAVGGVRGQVGRALALQHAGSSADALAEADRAVQAARVIGYPPLLAESLLAYGTIAMERRKDEPAEHALREAAEIANSQERATRLVIEADARRVYVHYGLTGRGIESIQEKLETIVAMSKSLRGDHFARPLLLNNIGSVYAGAGHLAEARRYYQAAHDELRDVADPDLELLCIDQNLAETTDDPVERERLARSVWNRYRETLGPHHLKTIEALWQVSQSVGDVNESQRLLDQACESYQTHHADQARLVFACASSSGLLAWLRGDVGHAVAWLESARAVVARADDQHDRSRIVDGLLALTRHDDVRAVASVRELLDGCTPGAPMWQCKIAHLANLIAGEANLATGDIFAAVRQIARARSGFRDLATRYPDPAFRLAAERFGP